MSWVAHFDELIAPDFRLPRNGSLWQIHEPGAGNCLFEINGGASVGFTLDQSGKNVFPYFNTQPAGMQQVNDGLVVAEVEGQAYVVAIEMKTSNSDRNRSKALRQIHAARCFVQWVEQLSRLNGYGAGEYKFVGVISLKPRSQPRKGTTSRQQDIPAPAPSPHGGYPVFMLENHPRTSVQELVKKLKA
jgi:hypothetical protein